MKKSVCLLISLILALTAFVPAGAETYKSENLLETYSSSEVVAMFPEVCKYLAGELRALNEDISLRQFNLNIKYIDSIYSSVLCENPDIFYTNPSNFETTATGDTDILIALRPYYLFDTEKIPDEINKFETACDRFLKNADNSWSDFNKARFIHDKIATTVEYNMDPYSTDIQIYTAYGAIVNCDAVCEGYTLAYNYLLSKVGIEAHYIQSHIMAHSWSMVRIGGKFYHVDVTHDDPSYDNLGRVNHTYFLCSDRLLKADGKHYNWISGTKATDDTYDNAWWRGVNTIIFHVGGFDYYVNQTYSSSIYGALRRHNPENDNEKMVEKITTRWQVQGMSDGAFWERAFCYIAYDGNYFYYNSTNQVFRRKVDSTYFEIIYTKPDTLKYDIYGLAFKTDGSLWITIKSDPNSPDVEYKLESLLPEGTDPDTPIDPEKLPYNEVEGGVNLHTLDVYSANMIIPEEIDGKQIVQLGDGLFKNNTTIQSVILPNGLRKIGKSTFEGCTSLKSITLPSGLTEIGDGAFYSCEKLEEIYIPYTVTTIGKNVFYGCRNLTIKGHKGTAAESYAKSYGLYFESADEEQKTTTPTEQKKTSTTKKYKISLTMYASQTYTIPKSYIGSGSTFGSSKKSVAKISKKGKITALKKGTATLTAKSEKIETTVTVKVKNPKLGFSKKTLRVGNGFKIKMTGIKNVKYSSSNKKVVSVTSKGKITAKKKGKAVITLKIASVKLKLTITVIK